MLILDILKYIQLEKSVKEKNLADFLCICNKGIHMNEISLEYTKWNCKYHMVFAPKSRRKEE